MQAILAQIQNAKTLEEATNALGAFKAHTLPEQATALTGKELLSNKVRTCFS